MALLPTPSVDYSDWDFESLRARMYNLIGAVFPEWTEQSVASFGNVLVELFAHVGDVLGFYLDARARETRITTATQRESIVALARLLGYTPEGASAARTDGLLSLAAPAPATVVIPAGTAVLSSDAVDPVTFQTLETVTFPIGTVAVPATLEHSTTHEESYNATGRAFQELVLRSTPFVDRVYDDTGVTGPSETVTADNGAYARVDSLLDATPTSRVYTLYIDEAQRAHIRFGDGAQGQAPAGIIEVTYKTGGGVRGNVEAGALSRIEGAFTDVNGGAVRLSVTNPEAATGGAPRKSRYDIQSEVPVRLRALERTVGREDFETNARRVPGVRRALMLTSNEVPSVGENRGRLYIVPAGGGKPSSSMKAAVHTMVTKTYPSTLTFQVDVLDPSYLTVNIHAVVYLTRAGTGKQVDQLIRERLVDFFAPVLDEGTDDARDNPDIDFGFYLSKTSEGKYGGSFALSDIINVVRDTPGVKKVGASINDFLVNNLHGDLPILAHQFPRLGVVTLYNGETRTALAGT